LMPTGRLNMRRIRDVLRLKFWQGLSERAIAASLGLSKGSVGSYTQRAHHAGLTWPLPEGLDDDSLELLFFPAPPTVPDAERLVPDWAAMGASNYTYAEAVASEGLEDWILAHARMFGFLGGVPKAVVPDNLKAAVIKADRFDPGLNRTYAEMAAHYGTAILPARPRKPRDKAKVEVAVQVAQRWILARLRNHRFFSLAELNMRIMPGYGASRADLFATFDRPHLQPLPAEPYLFAR
jgi:transposase